MSPGPAPSIGAGPWVVSVVSRTCGKRRAVYASICSKPMEAAMTRNSVFFVILLVAGCSSGVNSTADAQKAYLGLDASVDKAVTLGFNGFNTANSANISPQSTSGTVSGTITVTGQVDQGTSSNKGMRS